MAAFLPPVINDIRIAHARSTSPLTTGTLWTYTGGILLTGIYGVVRTAIQAQATNCKLSVKNDGLTAVDLCANADITGDAIGTLLRAVNPTVATVLQEFTNGVATMDDVYDINRATVCTTSGIITVTFGAASTGVIDWYLAWTPLVQGSTVQ